MKQQLCLAHGIHLAICDVLFKKRSSDDAETIEDTVSEEMDDASESLDSLQSGLTVNIDECGDEAPPTSRLITTSMTLLKEFEK